MFIQGCDHVKDLVWGGGLTWGEVMGQFEREYSAFNFEHADVAMYRRHFDDKEREARDPARRRAGLSRLRRGHQVQPPLQPAGGPRRHLGDRAHRLHRPGAQPGPRRRPRPTSPAARTSAFPCSRRRTGHDAAKSDRRPRLPFLLEIGSEEIPARFIPDSAARAGGPAGGRPGARPTWPSTACGCWPRRAAWPCSSTAWPARQPDRELEIKGPPVSVAFDADGPAHAGGGGLRPQGGRRPGRLRAAAATSAASSCWPGAPEPGRPAAEVLAEVPASAGAGPALPQDHALGRPGPGVPAAPAVARGPAGRRGGAPVAVGDLQAGRVTRGHRTLAGDGRCRSRPPGDYAGRAARSRRDRRPGRAAAS